MSEFLKEFKKTDNISPTQILNKYFDADRSNISFRTHLTQPLAVAIMETIRDELKDNGFTLTAKVLDDYIFNYKCDMTSYNRLSRIEVADALKRMFQDIDQSQQKPKVE